MSDLDMQVRANHHRNIVCVFARGPVITHYLGLEATQLCTLKMRNEEFDREFDKVMPHTPAQFAHRYAGSADAVKMIPLSGAAVRVLTGILRGQPQEVVAQTLNQLENHMSEEATFRKPDGPVAQIHMFLDKKLEAIKAGKVSRKELIETLVAKDYSLGTITTQCGVWAKNNGITFSRPAQAEATKKAAAKAARVRKPKAS